MIALLSAIFGPPRALRDASARLYAAAVAAARDPIFYRDHGVKDTTDGRFDMIVLHVALLARRLSTELPDGPALSQAVFDLMCSDMDESLREMGVGDLRVGKEVKKMAKAYLGRAQVYGAVLDSDDRGALEEALARNLFRGERGDAAAVAIYVRRTADALALLPGPTLLAGEVVFPSPSEAGP